MKKINWIKVLTPSASTARKALLAAFTPFGSLGGTYLAGLMVRHANTSSLKRRACSARAIQTHLRELDGQDPSKLECDGPFPGVRTPTSGTHICLYAGRGRERRSSLEEGPHVFIDFGRSPSASRATAIMAGLERAGLSYMASARANDLRAADGHVSVPREEILAALVERARDSLQGCESEYYGRTWPEQQAEAVARARKDLAFFEGLR